MSGQLLCFCSYYILKKPTFIISHYWLQQGLFLFFFYFFLFCKNLHYYLAGHFKWIIFTPTSPSSLLGAPCFDEMTPDEAPPPSHRPPLSLFPSPASVDSPRQAAPCSGLLLISLTDADDSIRAEPKQEDALAAPAAKPSFLHFSVVIRRPPLDQHFGTSISCCAPFYPALPPPRI